MKSGLSPGIPITGLRMAKTVSGGICFQVEWDFRALESKDFSRKNLSTGLKAVCACVVQLGFILSRAHRFLHRDT